MAITQVDVEQSTRDLSRSMDDLIETALRVKFERDALLAAMREIEEICTESNSTFRKRMGTHVGNILATTRTAITKATA